MDRITVGSLVKHRLHGAIGLVVNHTMWDGDWGAFEVKFIKPANTGRLKDQIYFVDRADRWALVSGCDNQ